MLHLMYTLDSVCELNGYYKAIILHGKEYLSIFLLFCTQLTFDLILRPRDIFRFDIHPISVFNTYKNLMSIDASFYPILPAEVFLS